MTMTNDQKAALICMMQEEILAGIHEKEAECNRQALEAGDNTTMKLARIATAMGLKEAEVIVLRTAKKLLQKENDELRREITEKIAEALVKN